MTNTGFLSSPSGRLLLAIAGLNALAMALLGWIGPSSIQWAILAIVPLSSIIGGLFVVGLAVDREDASVLFLEISLPFAAGLAYAGLYLAPKAGLMIATMFGVAGAFAVMLAVALRDHSPARENEHEPEATNSLTAPHRA